MMCIVAQHIGLLVCRGNAVAVSSKPVHAGFLSERSLEGL